MLRISEAQRAFFDREATDDFVARSATRLSQEFPDDAEALGRDGLRTVVRAGMARAARHGVDDEHGIDIWVNLMLMLGADFDTDPQLGWASDVLVAPDIAPKQVADALDVASRAYLDTVHGPEHIHYVEAARRMRALTVTDLPHEPGDVRLWLAKVFPPKVAYLGAGGLSDLIERAEGHARDATGDHARVGLCAGMMLVYGHRFDVDPALPWVGPWMRSLVAGRWTR